jgi:initiation factor 1A
MVKNTTGGNKQKGQARKFANSSTQQSNKLRVSENEYEIHGQVTQLLGNGMCYVDCIDSIKLCIIRGKFRGRGKKDNILKKGTWVLVGVRDWESITENKKQMQKCDLLEVYSELDKEKLKTLPGKWTKFISNDNLFTQTTEVAGEFDFIDDTNEEYKKIMEDEINRGTAQIIKISEDEEINVDDI